MLPHAIVGKTHMMKQSMHDELKSKMQHKKSFLLGKILRYMINVVDDGKSAGDIYGDGEK